MLEPSDEPQRAPTSTEKEVGEEKDILKNDIENKQGYEEILIKTLRIKEEKKYSPTEEKKKDLLSGERGGYRSRVNIKRGEAEPIFVKGSV